ncbi:type IV secretory system conjugative DNA transfer family protein [Streptomyces bohaiensis]|uniref:type IV secretory system conjugative DNA transfer family protein n=1 Tax=Streptomyces bohaiensis TaxID=1431344 RepID=UPI003B78D5A8
MTTTNGRIDDNTVLLFTGLAAAASIAAAATAAGTLARAATGTLDGTQLRGSWLGTTGHALIRGPGAAWDPAPPAWLYYTLTIAIWCTTLAVTVWIWQRIKRGHTGGAQWGDRTGEKKLALPEHPQQRRNRLTVGRGRTTGRILGARTNISVTVIGVPGSAKTVGVLIPNAVEWAGPAVITTAKPADLDRIYARRRMLGPVYVIAPAGIPGRTTHRWSPVDYCTDPKAASRMAKWMADAAASAGDPRAASWVSQASSILKGILLAANLDGGGVPKMREWLALGEDAVDHVVAILEDHGHLETARDYAGPWLRLHPDGKGSISFTLNVLAQVYDDEEVQEATSGSDFTAEHLLATNGTLCIVASEGDAPRYAPLITAIIASVIHAAEDQYKRTGLPLEPALGILVDEAGNMLRYKRLPNVITVGRGMGIVCLTIWHDISQLQDAIGANGARTVLSASGLRVLLPGCFDRETLSYFRDILGRTEVERSSRSVGSGGSTSTSYQVSETDLAPTHALREQDDFTAIAVDSNRRPVRVRMRLTFRSPDAHRRNFDRGLTRYMDLPDSEHVKDPAP